MRNHLQSTSQHFRNLRSPTDGENIVPDWLIKNCQKNPPVSQNLLPFHKSVKTKQNAKSRQSWALSFCTENLIDPVVNEMEQIFPLNIFRGKRNTFRGIHLFLVFPE